MVLRISEVLDQHFESQHATPPHETMRNQALEQAAKYGIPFEIASEIINRRLQVASDLYQEIIKVQVDAQGKIGEIRAQVEAERVAKNVMENYGDLSDRLSALGAAATKDIRDMIA
jgi:hypothetical protein